MSQWWYIWEQIPSFWTIFLRGINYEQNVNNSVPYSTLKEKLWKMLINLQEKKNNYNINADFIYFCLFYGNIFRIWYYTVRVMISLSGARWYPRHKTCYVSIDIVFICLLFLILISDQNVAVKKSINSIESLERSSMKGDCIAIMGWMDLRVKRKFLKQYASMFFFLSHFKLLNPLSL